MDNLYANTAAAFNNLDGDSYENACARAGLSADETATVAPLLGKICAAYEAVENSYDDGGDGLSYSAALENLGVTGDEKAVALKLISDDLSIA